MWKSDALRHPEEPLRRRGIFQIGQTLMELVVVIGIATLVVGALVFATIASLRNANLAKNQSQAVKLAQEGIERVRAGRDRNQCIIIAGINVNSWNGNSSCPNPVGTIWDYHISGDCEQEQGMVSTKCYFNVASSGGLQNIGFAQGTFPKDQAEGIPQANPLFKRAIILSDDINSNKDFSDDDYRCVKKVTVQVVWDDFSGSHKTELITLLRNPNPPINCR